MTTTRFEIAAALAPVSGAAGLCASGFTHPNGSGAGPKARGTVGRYPTPNVVGISVRAA